MGRARSQMRIGHVSTFPPLRCGIASFVSDLIYAMPGFEHLRYRLHYGSGREVGDTAHADINSVEDLAELARWISDSNCDLVSLQHEFGIWGGDEGENIHAFLDNLKKPLVSVLHTTFGPGVRSQVQAEILKRLIRESLRVIVLTSASKAAAEAHYGRSIQHMVVVPHGVPDRAYVAPPDWSQVGGCREDGPLRLITPGFLRPDKGLEIVLFALRELCERGYEISYWIAGEPQRQFPEQSSYRTLLERLISTLHLESVVRIEGRYLSVDEQVRAIERCHLGVFPYQISSWASSGTVPLVMCVGRPVMCTPFEYARIKAKESPGIFLTSGFDSSAIASGIEAFMLADGYAAISEAVYSATRHWTWSTVGKAIGEVYLTCRNAS